MRVGELNGKWSILFRVSLVLMPFLVAWAAFVTRAVYDIRQDMAASHARYEVWMARTEGNRFTQSDWAVSLKQLNDDMPPRWVRDALKRHERQIEKMHEKIDKLEGKL